MKTLMRKLINYRFCKLAKRLKKLEDSSANWSLKEPILKKMVELNDSYLQ